MAAYKKLNSGFLPFIQKEKVTSPFTDIQNRAKIDASLKTIMGVERIHVNSINLLNKEFGPNQEPVYEPDNGDSRVRFVGDISTTFTPNGMYTRVPLDSFVEVAFYGTGLNLLCIANAFNRDIRVSVDGGSEGANIFPQNLSAVLEDRNYKMNTVIPITSNLSLTWHTVKIRYNTTSELDVYGFEILNESSQITVKAGKAHGNGYEYELASDQLIDYNLGFDNVLDVNVGTKGGRVVTYLNPADGTLKKRLTKTDAAAAYLASADHTNEAPYRVINFREFGRNRADDFSTLGTGFANLAFTLDDGTTTLTGSQIRADIGADKGIRINSPNYITLTFVGTGLDIIMQYEPLAGTDHLDIYVDGVFVGTTDEFNGGQPFNEQRQIRICSGLPYGTHTVKIACSVGGGAAANVSDFIPYQPKKPALPEGAIELADYNVMADFVANTTASASTIASGVLRKSCGREFVYEGTGWGIPLETLSASGLLANTNVSGAKIKYTFFGTGFDFRFKIHSNSSSDVTVDIDGSTDHSSLTTSVYGTGATFTASTGTLDQLDATTSFGSGLSINGLALGTHTVTFTNNTTNFLVFEALDIITPIHAPHTTFGSRSMKDCRNFDSMKDVNKEVNGRSEKAWAVFDSINSLAFSSQNVSQILKETTGGLWVYLEDGFIDNKSLAQISSKANSDYSVSSFGSTSTLRAKNLVRVAIGNTAGGGMDSPEIYLQCYGKLEKDDLEE